MMNENKTIRILAVDDEQPILDSYVQALNPSMENHQNIRQMRDMAARLFAGDELKSILPENNGYDLVTCQQGDEAIDIIRQSRIANKPFSVVFMDMRMPPGIDGVTAAEKIRDLDCEIQIVVVTGYSDVAAEDIAVRILPTDKLFYLQKPFHAPEIRQFAAALAAKWETERQIRNMNNHLEELVQQRTNELENTNDRLLREIGEHKEARNKLQESDEFVKTILNSVRTAIVTIDATTHEIIDINNYAVEMIGVPRENIVGRMCKYFICPTMDGKCPVLQSSSGLHLTERIMIRGDGQRVPILKSAVIINRGGRKCILENFIDISDRKKAEQDIQYHIQQVAETRNVAIFALAKLAESRDPETGEHLERLSSTSKILADELMKNSVYSEQIDERFVETIYHSSPLHDIGKVGIPDMILLKPGRLTSAEFEIMKQHAIIGANALDEAVKKGDSGGFFAMGAAIARFHHERFDGTGYPDGLKGTDIPLAARIVAVADVYDALTSARVYKPAFRAEVSRLMIEEQSGKHFDPVIVKAFLDRYDDILNVYQKSNVAKQSEVLDENMSPQLVFSGQTFSEHDPID